MTNKTFKIISIIGFTLFTSMLGIQTVYADAGDTAAHTVKMLNSGEEGMMVFEPAFIRVKKGESVTFLPTDPGHDSVSVYTPEGASGWAGKNSKEVTVTFDTEGVYLYKCTPHAMMGMVGVIQVGETHNKKAVKKAVKKLSKTVAMNKDRLKKYMADVK